LPPPRVRYLMENSFINWEVSRCLEVFIIWGRFVTVNPHSVLTT
jgi:hypothetical protein